MATKYRDKISYRTSLQPYRGLAPVPILQEEVPKPQLFVTNKYGHQLVELDSAVIKNIKWVLDDTGECNFSVPVYEPKICTPPFYPRLRLDEIQVRMGGQFVWQGVVWRETDGEATADYQAYGLLAYLWGRFITNRTLTFASTEQTEIAWGLMAEAQKDAGMNLNIQHGPWRPSSHVRSRRYLRDEHANILDLIKEFPGVQDGFDFDIEVTPDGLRRNFMAYYPMKGLSKPNIVVEIGREIVSFSLTQDGANMANDVWVTGGTAGDVKFEANYQDTDSIAEYGNMQAIVQDGQQKDVDWLQARAIAEVEKRKVPAVNPNMQIIKAPVNILSFIQPGDAIRFKVDQGRAKFDTQRRINSVDYSVAENTLALEVF